MTDQLTAGTQVWFFDDGHVYTGVVTGRAHDGSYLVDCQSYETDIRGIVRGLRLSDLYETEAEARAAMQAAERSV
jgi:hypothetical protein